MTEQYKKACAELLHYLKGICREDVDRIPDELMNFFRCNAELEYKCDFDYTLPLRDLQLMDETKGLISMICLHYWCKTEEERQKFIEHLKRNEVEYKLEQYRKMLEEY